MRIERSNKPRILVTGGAGYKGVVLVKALLEKRYPVTLLDNFIYGYEPVVHLVSNRNVRIVQRDIRNLDEAILGEHDVIYHLAGISGMPACAANPHSAEVINVEATRKLVSMLRPTQLLIYASTTSIYGNASGECDESVPVQSDSLYSRTKFAAEKIVQQRENSISLRFATVFGTSPRMRNDLLVNDFTYRALNEGTLVLFASRSKRTFVHIQDAISAYLFALEHADTMRGQVFNVGDERLNLSKLDIATAIKEHVRCEIVDSTLPDLDVRDFVVSFRKISQLGYKAKLSLDDGIVDLLRLYSFYKAYSHYRVI
jgi:nucleoside-diphosphate-sugar epimerase